MGKSIAVLLLRWQTDATPADRPRTREESEEARGRDRDGIPDCRPRRAPPTEHRSGYSAGPSAGSGSTRKGGFTGGEGRRLALLCRYDRRGNGSGARNLVSHRETRLGERQAM